MNNLFSVLKTKAIVFIEDDFTFSDKKTKIFYDLIRLDRDDQSKLIVEIGERDKTLSTSLKSFIDTLPSWFNDLSDWDENVIVDDAEDAFKQLNTSVHDEIFTLYENIDIARLKALDKVLLKYGVGANIPPKYMMFFEGYIDKSDIRKPYRIYSTYSREMVNSLKNDLQYFSASEYESVSVIVDDQIGSEVCAERILKDISEYNAQQRNNIVGVVYSSKNTNTFLRDGNIYFDFVEKKDDTNSLKSGLAKSAYSFFLTKLKNETIGNINSSFKIMEQSPNIAYYLSQMALNEGVSDYVVITDWLAQLHYYHKNQSEIVVDLIRLSKIISSLEDFSDEITIEEKLLNLNTADAFDTSINRFFVNTVPGDIFINTKTNELYVLIGQECDYMMGGKKRKRRMQACEFLPIKLLPPTGLEKINSDLSYVYINNYLHPKDNNRYCMQINYTKKVEIDNEITNLSSFNREGYCSIDIKSPLDDEIQTLAQNYLQGYHEWLQEYYQYLLKLKSSDEDGFQMLFQKHFCAPKAMDCTSFECNGNRIEFPLQRIARLSSKYAMYLYKLFLEHKGRLPYMAINLSQFQPIEVSALFEEHEHPLTINVLLSSNINKNSFESLVKLIWHIDENSFNDFVCRCGKESIAIGSEIILKEKQGTVEVTADKHFKYKKVFDKKNCKIVLEINQ